VQGGYWHEERPVYLAPQLRWSVERTAFYSADAARADTRANPSNRLDVPCTLDVTEETTIAAGRRLHAKLGANAGGAVCLLNFASAKNPGGGFEGGAIAQEESLALSSGLYACLANHMDNFYIPHRNDPCHGLYSHAMLHSPRVPFFRDDSGDFSDMWCAGVITSPAPNAGVALSKHVSETVVVETLRERIGRILAVAQEYGYTHLVLGAFGCGVFRNDPLDVAMAFDYWLGDSGKFASAFQEVVFAIPFDAHNFPVFSEYFGAEPSQRRTMKRQPKQHQAGRETRQKGGKSSGAKTRRKDLRAQKSALPDE